MNSKYKTLKIIILLTIINISCLFSQTSEGTNFWVAFSPNSNFTPTYFIKLIISSKVNNNVNVTIPSKGFSKNVILNANSSVSIDIPRDLVVERTTEVVTKNAINVTSSNPISLYALNAEYQSSDATLVLPVSTLGNNYIITTTPYNFMPPYFNIVAIEDNTNIAIRVKGRTEGGVNNGVINVNLDKGENYQVLADDITNNDLTGTEIISSKNIAVFAGLIRTKYPSSAGSSDHIYEQMFPVNTWGTEYIAIPTNNNNSINNDIYRIISNTDANSIFINGVKRATLNRLQHFEYESNQISFIKSEKPICITQFAKSGAGQNGDPFSIVLSSVEQMIDTIVFNAFPAVNVVNDFNLGIVVPTNSKNKVFLDGLSIANRFKNVPSKPDFSWAYIDKNTITPGDHILTSEQGVNAYIYALGQVESYGYLAGAGIKNLSLILKTDKQNNEICFGDSVQLDVITSSGTPPFTYSWTPSNLVSNPNFKTPIAFPTATTQFTVEVTDAKNEKVSAKLNVTVNPFPNVTITGKDSVCFGSEFTLIASGGVNYKWYKEGISPLNVISYTNQLRYKPSKSGRYIVEVDNGKCTSYDTTFVTVCPLPIIDISNWQYGVCPNSLERYKTLDSTKYAYEWNIIGGVIDSTNIGANIQNGGSKAIDAFAVRIKWGIGPWGKITLNVVDKECGCENSFSIDVPVNGEMNPNLFANGQPTKDSVGVCEGEIVILEAKGSVGDYKWFKLDNNSPTLVGTSSTFKVLTAGNYISTVTDNNTGCFGKDTINVQFYPVPLANSGTYSPICDGDEMNLTGNGGDNYAWYDLNFNLLSSNRNYKLKPPVGLNKYILRVSTFRGCFDFDTTEVIVNPVPDLSELSNNYNSCINESLTIVMNNNYQYSWKNTQVVELSNSNTFTSSMVSSQTFTLTATNEFNCKTTKDFFVKVNPKPIVDAGQDTVICKNAAIKLYKETNGDEAVWTDDDNNVYVNDSTKYVNFTKTKTMKLRVTNDFGCSAEDTKLVVVQPLVQADAGLDTIHICIGNSTDLIGKGSGTLTWLDENNKIISIASQIKVNPNTTSKYYLKVYDNIGCEDIDSCVVAVHDYPLADAGKDLRICFGESTTITGNAGYYVQWSELGKGVISSSMTSITVSPAATTKYIYSVSSEYGCTTHDTMEIVVVPLPQTKANDDLVICNGESVELTASGAISYTWYDDKNNVISNNSKALVSPIVTTKYFVVGTSDICSAIDSTLVTVKQISDVIQAKDNFFKSSDLNVRIPIYLQNESNLLDCLEDDNNITIKINYTMFNPTGAIAETYTPKFSKTLNKVTEQWEINVGLPKNAKPDNNKVLFSLVGNVHLGNTDTTAIDIDQVKWNKLNTSDTLIDGRLILTNVCYVNGARLITYSNLNQLQISPNPANTEIAVACDLDESQSNITLKILDMTGNEVKSLRLNPMPLDKKQILTSVNVADISSGPYKIILQTEKYVISDILLIVK